MYSTYFIEKCQNYIGGTEERVFEIMLRDVQYLLHRKMSKLHWGNRRTSVGLCLCQSLLVQVSALFSITQLSLNLTEFGQVESCNFFSLFNLLLISFDLGLQLINQTLHTLMVFPIFVRSISQFLNSALRFAQVLLSISKTSAFSIQFRFKLPDTSLHLIHCLLASLQGVGFSLIKTLLHILDLALIKLPVPLIGLSTFLFIPQLISKTSSINHGFLGFLFREMGLTGHFIHVSMQSLHFRLQLPLGTSNSLIGACKVRQLLIGV